MPLGAPHTGPSARARTPARPSAVGAAGASRCATSDAQDAVLARGHVGQLDQVAGPDRAVADEQQRARRRAARGSRRQRVGQRLGRVAVAQRRRDDDRTARRRALGLAQEDVPLLGALLARGAERDDGDGRAGAAARTDVPGDEVGAVAQRVVGAARLDGTEVERPVAARTTARSRSGAPARGRASTRFAARPRGTPREWPTPTPRRGCRRRSRRDR